MNYLADLLTFYKYQFFSFRVSLPNKLHFSLENIPKSYHRKKPTSTSPASSFTTSRSCDSIYHSKKSKTPKIPVAQSTARLLERVNSDNTDHKSRKTSNDK